MKPIRLSGHAKLQLKYRGVNEQEIEDTITSESWEKSESNRLECKRNFDYNKEWNNKFYKTKQVRPIFVEESTEIVVITVYTYYF